MFDKLVESTKSRQGRRSGRYFIVTTAIYSLALLSFGIGTIIGFSPALAEEYDLTAMLTPPVPRDSSPPPESTPRTVNTTAQPNIFAAPTRPPTEILPPDQVKPGPLVPYNGPTASSGLFSGENKGGIPGSGNFNTEAPPPPPEIKSTPKPTPSPTPEAKPPGVTKVSEGVLQGRAIKRQKPVYPAIAKSVRASGMVQVLVTISEEGRVTEANAISGHPMLRPAAVEAARQWVFTPTLLSNVPVKVQGVLSFNFLLD
ncbi:MAG: TonB family protein [Blastocatellales bacterium]